MSDTETRRGSDPRSEREWLVDLILRLAPNANPEDPIFQESISTLRHIVVLFAVPQLPLTGKDLERARASAARMGLSLDPPAPKSLDTAAVCGLTEDAKGRYERGVQGGMVEYQTLNEIAVPIAYERDALRKILVQCIEACDGAAVEHVSLEFLASVPREIRTQIANAHKRGPRGA